ncbi:PREDICTED: DNA ligase 1 [Nicotiana attenuata]|uniref:DNA ligase 1 n=1 Tax=Nicotiana attenuata TaxID=49451 RepID=UPI000904F8AD|nr:PREDICTED: DNA ligase 1 [Nicotiana attenuata]
MQETEDKGKHDGATKTENKEINEKEKEDKHSDEGGKEDKDEKEDKDKKKKDKDEKTKEKDGKDKTKKNKKDKKEKNPDDRKDLEKLKLKVEKIDARMQDLEDQREVILKLLNEAGQITANANPEKTFRALNRANKKNKQSQQTHQLEIEMGDVDNVNENIRDDQADPNPRVTPEAIKLLLFPFSVTGEA